MPPRRVELLTSRLQGVCSNHLSYKDREDTVFVFKQPMDVLLEIRGTKTLLSI